MHGGADLRLLSGAFCSMNDYWRMVCLLPRCYNLSLANMLSNFILFYQDDADQEATQQSQLQRITPASSFVQSTAYTLLNYTCVHSLFTTLFPGYIVTNALFSAGLAMGLMLGEYRFNHDIIQATQPASPTHRLLNSSSLADRCQYFVTWSAILLERFCKWLDCSGYLEINSLLLKLAIANGTFVSVAVMKSSVDNTFASIYNPSTSAHAPLVPKKTAAATTIILAKVHLRKSRGSLWLLVA